MVLLRPQVIAAMKSPTIGARPSLSMEGTQLVSRGAVVWAKKAAWFRNQPYTAVYPHTGQIQVRLRFAEIASRAKGTKGLDPETGLPQAAALIYKEMSGYRAPDRIDPAKYPSKVRRTFRTAKELETLLRRRGREYVPAALPGAPR